MSSNIYNDADDGDIEKSLRLQSSQMVTVVLSMAGFGSKCVIVEMMASLLMIIALVVTVVMLIGFVKLNLCVYSSNVCSGVFVFLEFGTSR